MQSLNSMIEKVSQTGTTEKRENSLHSEDMMDKVWRGLVAFKLQHEPIGSTDYKYWDRSLAEFTDQELVVGLRRAADHKGYLTIGDFRALCKTEPPKAAHKLFLPYKPQKASPDTKAKYMDKLRAML